MHSCYTRSIEYHNDREKSYQKTKDGLSVNGDCEETERNGGNDRRIFLYPAALNLVDIETPLLQEKFVLNPNKRQIRSRTVLFITIW